MDQSIADRDVARQLNVEPYWLPFTPNRHFKSNPNPRLMASAKGAYYRTIDNRLLFDSLSGLWCSPIGHGHPKLVEALRRQAETLDYCPSFQISSPVTIRLAERIAAMAPAGLEQVFFTTSGSEAVDTALKIALGFYRMRGEAHRFRMIGRERGYHGVGFGGMSVGGMVGNRKMFAAAMLNGVDHLCHTHRPSEMAFSRGQPSFGANLADDLERLVALHDASTIAAVIVEPVQGSAGVIVPPLGYLQRLREICTRNGILLVFDEVITGFGRLGENFAAQRFGVVPDMITFAKAVTNGVVPMGGVIVRKEIHDAFMSGPPHAVELAHGYTYSGHPLAAAVGHATLDVMEQEGLFGRARELEGILEATMHSLKGEPGVLDIRNFGLAAAVDLAPSSEGPGLRAVRMFERGLEDGLLLRFTGDTIAVAPPFISSAAELERMVETLRKLIRTVS